MIQRIVHRDLPALQDLYEELVGSRGTLSDMERVFEPLNNNEAYYLLGYKLDGVLAGSVMGVICYDLVNACKPFMVVENVIVSSKAQGKGVGKQLMLALEEIANEHNCEYMMLCSSSYRKEAHQFYVSLGYPIDSVQGFRKML